MSAANYLTRVEDTLAAIQAETWNGLLALQDGPTPFMRHEYLNDLSLSLSACPQTGWTARVITMWEGDALAAACVLYIKDHSYGEYVFDWAWANAYQHHGLPYYPKGVISVPFTPVPGTRLLARNSQERTLLIQATLEQAKQAGLSSVHVLFASEDDLECCERAGLMLRHTVQFHWENLGEAGADLAMRYRDFDDFLARLNQEKRKKIRQERRKVDQAGVGFRWARGGDIQTADWDFFYRCYERTYLEHGNPPYLSRQFFDLQAQHASASWLIFIAERAGQPIACSLIGLQESRTSAGITHRTAYGRYWGALERVDCLHFEACYYQPIAWCIAHGFDRFEGGAQGEHKMARALMPVRTSSAHWLAHPSFAEAVQRFLEREGDGVASYLEDLRGHSPFRRD
jgi:predicted N-acyltransferase